MISSGGTVKAIQQSPRHANKILLFGLTPVIEIFSYLYLLSNAFKSCFSVVSNSKNTVAVYAFGFAVAFILTLNTSDLICLVACMFLIIKKMSSNKKTTTLNSKTSDTPVLDDILSSLSTPATVETKKTINTTRVAILIVIIGVIIYLAYRYRDKWMHHQVNIKLPFTKKQIKEKTNKETSSEDINVFS